jgi:beta-RFAP synthase
MAVALYPHMTQPIANRALFEAVRIDAPARLHLGFFDLNGDLGRRFGSVGLTLDGFATEIEVRPAKALTVEGTSSVRVLGCVASLMGKLGLTSGLSVRVIRAIPEHAGLGSGTQLALALGAGLSRLYGLDLDTRTLATLTRRGMRSGIGIGAFDSGGFLVDGGRGAAGGPPPVIVQQDFPSDWRILLIFDRRGPGIHGQQEVAAFDTLPKFPAATAGELCRLVLMQALPALAERDCVTFGRAISRLQRVVGDYFAPAQSGRYASEDVAAVLNWLDAQQVPGFGQSSWGPTGFALLASPQAAAQLLHDVRRRFADRPDLHFEVVSARNSGSRIDVSTEALPRHGLQAVPSRPQTALSAITGASTGSGA